MHSVGCEKGAPKDGTFVSRWCKRRAVVIDVRHFARARGRGCEAADREPNPSHAYTAGFLGSKEFGMWLGDNLV